MGALPASGEGLRSITESGLPTRLGLLRATGPFSHPIIAGIFLAGMLPLYFTSAIKGWPRAFGIGAGILAFFSLSSAAFLALFLCVALIAYDWLQRRVTFLSWPLLAFSVVLIVAFLELAANSGAIGVLSRFTFDPQTAHFRMLIWDYGTVSVASHPFLGIGYEPYERASWMNPSVDNYWLLLAIRHGLPTVLAIMVVLISAIALLVLQSRGKEEGDRRIYIGYAIALFIYLVTGFTVAFFGAIVPLFYILLGGAISLVVPQRL
ncbi:MAG: O-antigen ligase family protein [Caenibius sp.]